MEIPIMRILEDTGQAPQLLGQRYGRRATLRPITGISLHIFTPPGTYPPFMYFYYL